VGRIAAMVALGAAVLVIALVLLGGGSSYTVTAQFENASQLVKGNLVEVAGVRAGTVKDISLGPNGSALVKMQMDSDYAPLHEGTTATVRSQSLSGIANRFVQLDMPTADQRGPSIPDGGSIPISDTTSEVDLDQLFNTLDKRTIGHFRQVIKGFAHAYDGVGQPTNRGFHYFNPFLSTSRRVFDELTLDQRRFQRLIVDTASLSGALAERAPDLTQFVSNDNRMMAAIAAENRHLASAVGELPNFMRNFNTTSVNLRATLDDVDPLVNASKPVAKKLRPFTHQLRGFATDAVPAINDLEHIVRRKGPDNDLVELTKLQVPLADIAVGPVNRNGAERPGALPESAQSLTGGLPQLAYFRPYITEEAVSGWFDDYGHSGVYDANGGFGRISTLVTPFSLSAGVPDLSTPLINPGMTADQVIGTLQGAGLKIGYLHRCPGSNERPYPDGSNPFTDNGTLACDPSQVPPGN
jgi:phospholipid/cholesterol/gamma-HCH transport system substrate-binding protein